MQTIYKNGNYRIEAIVSGFRVLDANGNLMFPPFGPDSIELAVDSVDELAEHQGVVSHIS